MHDSAEAARNHILANISEYEGNISGLQESGSVPFLADGLVTKYVYKASITSVTKLFDFKPKSNFIYNGINKFSRGLNQQDYTKTKKQRKESKKALWQLANPDGVYPTQTPPVLDAKGVAVTKKRNKERKALRKKFNKYIKRVLTMGPQYKIKIERWLAIRLKKIDFDKKNPKETHRDITAWVHQYAGNLVDESHKKQAISMLAGNIPVRGDLSFPEDQFVVGANEASLEVDSDEEEEVDSKFRV